MHQGEITPCDMTDLLLIYYIYPAVNYIPNH